MQSFHPISIAPMMDYTDRHFRYLLRVISKHVGLYTEMVTTDAILHGNREQLLEYDPLEHPLALQLGGSDPLALAQCAKIAEEYGYDEVNLNVGCPSPRVQEGRFGACLMKEPQLVAECVAAMRDAVKIPVTVKTRIGVDERDSYAELAQFLEQVASAGCEHFILHARKAWLKGLSPKENREIPPLQYEVVYQIKHDFPRLRIVINGGFQTAEQVRAALEKVDGVMIGRLACQNPYFFALDLAAGDLPATPSLTRLEVIQQYLPYMQQQLAKGVCMSALARHLLGLFHGTPGARKWRRCLSENSHKENVGIGLIETALETTRSAESPSAF